MTFILDTDIQSLLGQESSAERLRIQRRIAELPEEDDVATTVINFEEQVRGWMGTLKRAKSFDDEIKAYDHLLTYLEATRRIEVLKFGSEAAAIANQLRKNRLRIGTMDLKIAAITLASGGTLITRNAVDFRKVPNLKFDDWSVNSGD